jgi:hypothetical protein
MGLVCLHRPRSRGERGHGDGQALVGRPVEGELFRRLRRAVSLEEVVPVDSAHHPLVQVADLLAGLAAFSRSDYESFTT